MHEIYRGSILDHGTNPRNRGVLDPADVDYETNNPLCGDNLRLTLRLDAAGRVTAVGWAGESCAITQAAASLLGERIVGRSRDDIRQLCPQDIFDMLGVPIPPNRTQCALLSLKALTIALYGPDEWYRHEDEDEA